MIAESRRIEYKPHATSLMCPRCGRYMHIGRVNFIASVSFRPDYAYGTTRGAADLEITPAAFMCSPEPDEPTCSWAHRPYVVGKECIKCDDYPQMIAIDSYLVPIISFLNERCIYTAGCCIAGNDDPDAKNRGYIQFFYTVPFWIWAKWRDIKLPNGGYALNLSHEATRVVFNFTGTDQVVNIVREMIDVLRTPQLETVMREYALLVRACAETLYDMYDLNATMEHDPNKRMSHENIRRPFSIFTGDETSLSSWLDQCEVYAWELVHRDDLRDPRWNNFYYAFSEILHHAEYDPNPENVPEHLVGVRLSTGEIIDYRRIPQEQLADPSESIYATVRLGCSWASAPFDLASINASRHEWLLNYLKRPIIHWYDGVHYITLPVDSDQTIDEKAVAEFVRTHPNEVKAKLDAWDKPDNERPDAVRAIYRVKREMDIVTIND